MSKFPPLYLTIAKNVTAGVRLVALRKMGPDWRKARQWTFVNGAAAYSTLDQGFNSDANGQNAVPIWYCHTGPQFRNERYADEVDGAHIKHEGWFCDADQDQKARGIVASLPHGRFISGYETSDNGERVYFGHVYDDEVDAALSADSAAERVADREREYNGRWRAAQDLSREIGEIEKRVRELYALRNHPGLQDDARLEIREKFDELRMKRETLATEYKDIEI